MNQVLKQHMQRVQINTTISERNSCLANPPESVDGWKWKIGIHRSTAWEKRWWKSLMGTHPWSSQGPSSWGHSCRGPYQGCRIRGRCTDPGTGLLTHHTEVQTNLVYSGTDRTRSCHVQNMWGQDSPLERKKQSIWKSFFLSFSFFSFHFPPHLSLLSPKLTSGISTLSETSCSYEHVLRDSVSAQFLKSPINRLNFITLIKFIMLVSACFSRRHLKSEILRGRGFSESAGKSFENEKLSKRSLPSSQVSPR